MGSTANGDRTSAAMPRCHECSAVFSRLLPSARRLRRSTLFSLSASRKNARAASMPGGPSPVGPSCPLSTSIEPTVAGLPKLPTGSYSRDMAHAIRTVGIVGSGIMGSGLAEVIARAGYDVVVASRSWATADAVLQTIDGALAKAVERGKATADVHQQTMRRITAAEGLVALADCDLVIESVVEELDVKVALFGELDRVTKPTAILATKTSTLPVIDLALATSRPEQVCGIHFFNPAPLMKLVEVVRPLTACAETID